MEENYAESGLVNLGSGDPTTKLRERLVADEFEKIEFVENSMPGMSWTDIAATAYFAYAESTGNKNYQGLPMPAFPDLPLPIQTAWEAAVRQAHRCRSINRDLLAISSARFNGWTRPQDGPVADRATPPQKAKTMDAEEKTTRYERISIEAIASICHEANRQFQVRQNEAGVSPHWDEAPESQRKSAIRGVEKALAGATPEELHESWCEFKFADGWTYGAVKDEVAKTHPCLVTYAALPEAQKLKDALFSGIVTALSDTYIHNDRGAMPDGTPII